MKRLIINADDYGLTEGCNRAIEALLTIGVVSSVSCMVSRLRVIPEALRGKSGIHLVRPHGGPTAIWESWNRQIADFFAMSKFLPTHLDTHHHVHAEPREWDIYRELCYRHDLACVPLLNNQRQQARKARLLCADWTEIRWYDGSRTTLESLLKKDFSLCQSVHLMCHPGYIDDDLRRESRMTHARERELEVLKDPTFGIWLRAEGIEIVGMDRL